MLPLAPLTQHLLAGQWSVGVSDILRFNGNLFGAGGGVSPQAICPAAAIVVQLMLLLLSN